MHALPIDVVVTLAASVVCILGGLVTLARMYMES